MSKFKGLFIALASMLLVVFLIGVISSATTPPEEEVIEKEVIKYVEVPVEVEKIVEVNKLATALSRAIVVSEYAAANQWENGVSYNAVDSDVATFTITGSGNSGKYYTDGNNWRLYASGNSQLTVTAKGNYRLIGIIIKYTRSGSGSLLTSADSEYLSGNLLLVNADSVTFHVGGTAQAQITNFELIYCEKAGD